MDELISVITASGGAAGRRYLNEAGFCDRILGDAVRTGVVLRARRGWYTVWPPHDPRYRALRVGGRVTGLAAIQALGGWVLESARLDVAVPVNAARLRDPVRRRLLSPRTTRNFRVLWVADRHDADTSTGLVDLADALAVVVRSESEETAVAALDWALHTGELDEVALADLAAHFPKGCQALVDRADPRCDSLPESLARTRLSALGLRVRSQVEVEGTSDIDLLVEGIVAVEVDGDLFHRESFEADRAKDLAITAAGMHVVRPSARHVFHEWGSVLRAIRRALRERGALVPDPTDLTPTATSTRSMRNIPRPPTLIPV